MHYIWPDIITENNIQQCKKEIRKVTQFGIKQCRHADESFTQDQIKTLL